MMKNILLTIFTSMLLNFFVSTSYADCMDENLACTKGCSTQTYIGAFAGIAGALGKNNELYNSGQQQLKESETCYSQCEAANKSCTVIEDQQLKARQQQETQVKAEAEARARANYVNSPPLLGAPAVKKPQLLLAHVKFMGAGNTDTQVELYKMLYATQGAGSWKRESEAWLRDKSHIAPQETGSTSEALLNSRSVDVQKLIRDADKLAKSKKPENKEKAYELYAQASQNTSDPKLKDRLEQMMNKIKQQPSSKVLSAQQRRDDEKRRLEVETERLRLARMQAERERVELETKAAESERLRQEQENILNRKYVAEFKRMFGLRVETRAYPNAEMRDRATEQWKQEGSILEPDGTTTMIDNYKPVETTKSGLLPGL